VHEDRLENNGGNFFRMLSEAPLYGGEVVKRGDQDVFERGLRDSEPARNRGWRMDIAKIGRMRLHAHQRIIMQAVISAFKLHNLVASRSRAGEANGMHGRFRAAVAEAYHLYRKALRDFLRQFPFEVMWHTEHGARGEPAFHRLHHRRM